MGGLRNFLQTPEGQRPGLLSRLLIWIPVLLVGVAVGIVGWHYFDLYTESPEFCGALCHANGPEYVTHKVSAHSGVECGACHIGPGLLPKFEAKYYGVGELISQLANTYERPIEAPVERMRPAEEVCEHCHSAEKEEADRLRAVSYFASDEANSEARTALLLRISAADPVGDDATEPHRRGIHWHAENEVWFASVDPERREIPWIRVFVDGQVTEYQEKGWRPTEEDLAGLVFRTMDCMDCHNRPTHVFEKPERALDEALADGRIDSGLPFVKREGLKLLTASYSTQEAGMDAMEGLAAFYRSDYPDVYSDERLLVDSAIEVLRDIYGHTVFPEMNLDWQAYPDNVGHLDSAGCFRCHDGEHTTGDGEAIPANCTTCHSVPVVSKGDRAPNANSLLSMFAKAANEPQSHLEPSFIEEHRILADVSCGDCHGAIEYGTDNTSFCANGACHGQQWPELDLSADFDHPIELENRHVEASCEACHAGVRRPAIDDCAECHQPFPRPHFGAECSKCHTTEGWEESASVWVSDVPAIPHSVGGGIECALCHGAGAFVPMPASHQGIPSESCVQCHEVAPVADISPISHGVEGLSDCLACHEAGKLMPADHVGRITDSCLLCHDSNGAGGTPSVPHPVDPATDCAACHEAGGGRPMPASHAGIALESCLLCHEVDVEPGIPSIPHRAESELDCGLCHGAGGPQPKPLSHEAYTLESCLVCHRMARAAGTPSIPHKVEELPDCLLCHGTDGVKPVPSGHARWISESCALCHEEE